MYNNSNCKCLQVYRRVSGMGQSHQCIRGKGAAQNAKLFSNIRIVIQIVHVAEKFRSEFANHSWRAQECRSTRFIITAFLPSGVPTSWPVCSCVHLAQGSSCQRSADTCRETPDNTCDDVGSQLKLCAEFYALVKGRSAGLGAVSVLKDLGVDINENTKIDKAVLEVRIDAPAGRGIAARRGAGRIRHVATSTLRV